MGSYVLSVEVIMIEKATPAKASKMAKAKKPAAKPSHPPTSVMVEAAIKGLKERKGSSLISIKKYIATNYKVDPVKNNHFIKKALASGVEKKTLLQAKGIGAAGSFKLAKVEVKPKKKPASASKKVKKATKPKTVKPKAKKAAPKKKAEKSAKKPSKPKKPVAKKAAKSSAKKPAKKAAPKKK